MPVLASAVPSKIPTAENLRRIVAKSPVRLCAWLCAGLAADSQPAAEPVAFACVPFKINPGCPPVFMQTKTHYLCRHYYEDKNITQRQSKHHYAGLQQKYGG